MQVSEDGVSLVVLDGPAKGTGVEVDGRPIVVGRSHTCRLRIDSTSISKRHCEVTCVDDRVVVRDLGSRNGTLVNGKKVTEASLMVGDVIRIGRITLRLQVTEAPTRPAASASGERPARKKTATRRGHAPTRQLRDVEKAASTPARGGPGSSAGAGSDAGIKSAALPPDAEVSEVDTDLKTEMSGTELEQTAEIAVSGTLVPADEAATLARERADTVGLEALHRVVLGLVTLFEFGEFYGHARRVRELAVIMARAMRLPPQQEGCLALASTLHDIGNVKVPAQILRKVGELTPEERAQVEQHPIVGSELLRGMDLPPAVVSAVRAHHERYDGTGYPDKLKGAQIPLLGRILAVAEAAIGMSSDRPYRPRRDPAAIIVILTRGMGTLYDPELVPVVLDVLKSPTLIS
ncbi:MAG: FHA domain-containing protein [Planctomycetes bacterium]|nr:FHA domain-containing protein [Planctomycetota bacterium]